MRIDRDHVPAICHVRSPSSLFHYFLIDARIRCLRLEAKPSAKPNSLVPSTSDKFILTSCLFPDKYRFGAAVQADPGLDIIALLRKSRHVACLPFFLFVLSTRSQKEAFQAVEKGKLNILAKAEFIRFSLNDHIEMNRFKQMCRINEFLSEHIINACWFQI